MPHPIDETTCVIPAHYSGESRIPYLPSRTGPDGRTLLATVHDNARRAGFRRVVVATNNPEQARVDLLSADHCAPTVVGTDDDCPCGTARCWQALQRQGMDPVRVVNLQLSEPDLTSEYLRGLVLAHAAHGHPVHTLAQAVGHGRGECSHRTEPPTTVWVTLPRLGNTYAMGWSRGQGGMTEAQRAADPGIAVVEIEPPRKRDDLQLTGYAIHVGAYSFTNAALRYAEQLIRNAPVGGTQADLRLEQMEWTTAGLRTGVEVVDVEKDGCPARRRAIKTAEDLAVWQCGGFSVAEG